MVMKTMINKVTKDKHRIPALIIKVILTLIMGIYYTFVVKDLIQIYGAYFKESSKIPATFAISFIFLIFSLLIFIFWFLFPIKNQVIFRIRSRLGLIRWVISIIFFGGISWLFLYSKWSYVLNEKWIRSLFFITGYFFVAWLFTNDPKKHYSLNGLLIGGLLFGSLFQVLNEIKTVVSYPFSLGWSEGNRIWDYSARLGKRLYNYPQDLEINAYIDLGRQTLWGLPFLLPNPSIILLRFWNVFLYTVPYFLFGLLAFFDRKLNKGIWILIGLWVFLFIHQGPIYTPLILVAVLTYTTKYLPLWAGFFVTMIASLFALYSRTTWMFAPAMWAVLNAFLEKNSNYVKNEKTRWTRAIILGIGGVLGSLVIGNLIILLRAHFAQDPSSVSGTVNVEAVNEMVSNQPLLWSRLLPNATNPQGILIAMIFATVPLIVLIIWLNKRCANKFNIWQKLLIVGELFAFLFVGIIASVKIGGGNNLHNLDMFLITLVLLASIVYKSGGYQIFQQLNQQSWFVKLLLIAIIFVPASQGMLTHMPLEIVNKVKADEALITIQKMVYDRSPGEILFIDQRQLLTFDYIHDVQLITEYEKKVLIDKSMADDYSYFQTFNRDLSQHRFSLIITSPVYLTYQEVEHEGGFGSENNAWVDWVSRPLLCFYEPVLTDKNIKYQMLVPREGELPEEMIMWCDEFDKYQPGN
jgi:hypothetical protein